MLSLNRKRGYCTFLTQPRLVVNALRLFWLLAILWLEFGVYLYTLQSCSWPEVGAHAVADTTHVLLIADPQILDHRSYRDRGPLLTRLTQFIVDWQLRKGWWATMRRLHPDRVVFLGDMMDGGRFSMSLGEYDDYFARFTRIFTTDDRLPVSYIPGNHDVGLGASSRFAPDVHQRYTKHFGALNQHFEVAGHAFLLVDALGLLEDNEARIRDGKSLDEWRPDNGPFALIRQFADQNSSQPVVLAIHVPLHRPDTASCGPLRERGRIRAGRGFGYENIVGEELSEYILTRLRPAIVFSGDDHDYCEHVHSLLGPEGNIVGAVTEITVKSFSMVMGIRKPGFQVLSLAPPELFSSSSFADDLCLLPDQLGLYLSGYLPLVGASLLLLLVSNILSTQDEHGLDALDRSRRGSDVYLPLASTSFGNPKLDRGRGRQQWMLGCNIMGGRRRIAIGLPLPSGARRCCSALMAGRRRQRQGRRMVEFVRDVLDVAWPALMAFVLSAGWSFS